jgi:Transposase
MRRLLDRCAGIDVGQALLVVCVRVFDGKGTLAQQVRSFGATTPDLMMLRDWLISLGVTHVAMESTGVYWKAPYYMLEDHFEMLLVNAAHLTRKSVRQWAGGSARRSVSGAGPCTYAAVDWPTTSCPSVIRRC